jgi:casein kinase 1
MYLNQSVGEFLIMKHIGRGSFGDVFLAIDKRNKKKRAMKIENSLRGSVRHEIEILRELKKCKGVPHLFLATKINEYSAMVTSLLGNSLAFYKRKQINQVFSTKTVCMIAIELISILEGIHSRSCVHRDLKPDNVLTSLEAPRGTPTLVLIDYGLSNKFRGEVSKKHIPFQVNCSFVGTSRFASINCHQGIAFSRRDDLESLGYTLVYLLKGRLPWQDINGMETSKIKTERHRSKKAPKSNAMEKSPLSRELIEKLTGKKKAETDIGSLCSHIPEPFKDFMVYVRNLQFEEDPNYSMLRDLFGTYLKQLNTPCDFIYDWMTEENLEGTPFKKPSSTEENIEPSKLIPKKPKKEPEKQLFSANDLGSIERLEETKEINMIKTKPKKHLQRQSLCL